MRTFIWLLSSIFGYGSLGLWVGRTYSWFRYARKKP